MPSGGNKKSPGGAKAKQSKTSLDKAATNNKDGATGAAQQDGDKDTNSGFGEYLRSSQGAEMLKLFVVANSIVMFLTVAWPQMKQSYQLLMSLIYGEDEEDL